MAHYAILWISYQATLVYTFLYKFVIRISFGVDFNSVFRLISLIRIAHKLPNDQEKAQVRITSIAGIVPQK